MAEIVDLPLDVAPLSASFEVEEPVVAELLVEVVDPEVEAPAVVETPVARTITTQVSRATDVSNVDDLELARALRDRLGGDPRVAVFGEQWLMEDRVPLQPRRPGAPPVEGVPARKGAAAYR